MLNGMGGSARPAVSWSAGAEAPASRELRSAGPGEERAGPAAGARGADRGESEWNGGWVGGWEPLRRIEEAAAQAWAMQWRLMGVVTGGGLGGRGARVLVVGGRGGMLGDMLSRVMGWEVLQVRVGDGVSRGRGVRWWGDRWDGAVVRGGSAEAESGGWLVPWRSRLKPGAPVLVALEAEGEGGGAGAGLAWWEAGGALEPAALDEAAVDRLVGVYIEQRLIDQRPGDELREMLLALAVERSLRAGETGAAYGWSELLVRELAGASGVSAGGWVGEVDHRAGVRAAVDALLSVSTAEGWSASLRGYLPGFLRSRARLLAMLGRREASECAAWAGELMEHRGRVVGADGGRVAVGQMVNGSGVDEGGGVRSEPLAGLGEGGAAWSPVERVSVAWPALAGAGADAGVARRAHRWAGSTLVTTDKSRSVVFEVTCPVDELDGLGLMLRVRRRRRWRERVKGLIPLRRFRGGGGGVGSMQVPLHLALYDASGPRPVRESTVTVGMGCEGFEVFRFGAISGSAGKKYLAVLNPGVAPVGVEVLGHEEPGSVTVMGGRRVGEFRVSAVPYASVSSPLPLCGQAGGPLVSVLIATHNSEAFIGACLGSLARQTYRNLEVVVIDNLSKDGTVELIRREYPWVKLITTGQDLEFCRGNNRGLEECRGEFVFVLNADTEVRPWGVERLVSEAMISPWISAVGCGISTKGSLTRYADVFFREWRMEGDLACLGTRCFALAPCGCAFLARRSAIERVGYLFDPGFTTNQEDHDFGLRIWASGGTCVHVPEECVLHIGGGVYGLVNPKRDRRIFRNGMLALNKSLSGRRGVALVRQALRARTWWAVLGLWDFVRSVRGWREARAAVQAGRAISDEALGLYASGRVPSVLASPVRSPAAEFCDEQMRRWEASAGRAGPGGGVGEGCGVEGRVPGVSVARVEFGSAVRGLGDAVVGGWANGARAAASGGERP